MTVGKYQNLTETKIVPAVDSTVYNGKVRVIYDVITTTTGTELQTHRIGALPIGARMLYCMASYGGVFSATNSANKISVGYTGVSDAFGSITGLGATGGSSIMSQALSSSAIVGRLDTRRTTELPLLLTIERGGATTITSGVSIIVMVFYAVE